MDDLPGWVARLVDGREAAAIDALGDGGAAAVRALIAGYRLPVPSDTHLREVHERLDAVLWMLADREPGALVVVMAERERATDDAAMGRLAFALGASRDPIATEALLDLLGHVDAHVRWCAVASLERIGTPEAVAPLPALLADGSSGVRFAALQAVATHLPRGSEAALRRYLERTDLPEGGRRLASQALARLEARGPAPAVTRKPGTARKQPATSKPATARKPARAGSKRR